MLTIVEDTVRRNWLASALIAAGIVMRLLVQAAYQPALVYIDTLKYLYGANPGADPVAYKIPLKMILALGGDLNTVELVQHLLGIAIAVAIYAVLVRRGTPRWLAALAMAPVLFDAYQYRNEHRSSPRRRSDTCRAALAGSERAGNGTPPSEPRSRPTTNR
jgi:hypothetical protein